MRWDRLFGDLESQLAAQERLELDSEVAERTRVERSKVTLTDRLAGSTGALVGAHLLGGRRLEGARRRGVGVVRARGALAPDPRRDRRRRLPVRAGPAAAQHGERTAADPGLRAAR
ncbi:hypothetical protein [Janibacter melonis]|uniref:hypothetical protein n=1 Tax=Janibacter melonis TaxID=262209 RepID=UPI0020956666|nr:hypothetical protein [Janibacter melonis]